MRLIRIFLPEMTKEQQIQASKVAAQISNSAGASVEQLYQAAKALSNLTNK